MDGGCLEEALAGIWPEMVCRESDFFTHNPYAAQVLTFLLIEGDGSARKKVVHS